MSAPDFLVQVALTAELTRRVGERVGVTRADGVSKSGVLAVASASDGTYKLLTGKRGRPFVFHPDDVTDLYVLAA